MREKLIKESLAYESLLRDKQKDRLSHAYLLICEDNRMRELFLEYAAQIIFCDKNGCGVCHICHKITNKNNIDIKYLVGTEVRVKDADWLVEDTQTKSLEGKKKLYIIDNAEAMQASVQNKLLKTYEEPNDAVIMFLAVSNETLLLSTIKSRAKKLFLPRLSNEAILKDLYEQGVDKGQAEIITAYAQGSIEKAEQMIDCESYNESFYATMEMLTTLRSSKQIIDYIYQPIFTKEKINIALDFLEIILSDVMLIKVKASVPQKITNRDYDLRKIGERFTTAGISVAILAINEARKMLRYNISPVSVAEKVLFDILEAEYKWR